MEVDCDNFQNNIKRGSGDGNQNISTITVSDNQQCYEFEEAFEFTGHGRFNNGLLLACGTCLVGVYMESLGASYILQAAQCEFDLTQSGKALLSSAIFIGIISSSVLWGYLADTKGRRGIMLPGTLLATLCSLLSSVSPWGWMFIVLRVLTGFFVSSCSACVYAYVGEMHTNSKRSRAIGRVAFFISLGLILLPAIAWLVLNGSWRLPLPLLGIDYSPWRLYIAICALPNLVYFLALLQYPESPKYLYASNKVDAALDVLKKIYSVNFKKSKEEFRVKEIKLLKPIIDDDGIFTSIWKQIIPLFQMPLLPCIALACINHFTVFALSSSFYLWFPAMLNNLQSRTSNEAATVCEIMAGSFNTSTESDSVMNTTVSTQEICQTETSELIFQIGLVMGVIFCGCYSIIGVSITKLGKKRLLVLLVGIPGCCTIGLYWAANDYLIVLLLVVLMCAGSAGSVITAVAVDLFPTKLRGMAVCISLMCGRLGAMVGSNVAGFMLVNSCSNTFILFGVEALISTGTILLFPKQQYIREKLAKKGIIFS